MQPNKVNMKRWTVVGEMNEMDCGLNEDETWTMKCGLKEVDETWTVKSTM